MADETSTQPSPASKGKAAKADTVVVRLISAGANDKFVLPDGTEVTTQGVQVLANEADDLLEYGAVHGVHLAYEAPTDKE